MTGFGILPDPAAPLSPDEARSAFAAILDGQAGDAGAVMAAIAMLTVLCGRPSAGVGVLCLAVAGILIADPWLSATPGYCTFTA